MCFLFSRTFSITKHDIQNINENSCGSLNINNNSKIGKNNNLNNSNINETINSENTINQYATTTTQNNLRSLNNSSATTTTTIIPEQQQQRLLISKSSSGSTQKDTTLDVDKKTRRQKTQTLSLKTESPPPTIITGSTETGDTPSVCGIGDGGTSGAPEVFLGGSCNPTTWRADVAIPALNELGISFYNPVI